MKNYSILLATVFLYAMPIDCMMNNNRPYTGASDAYNSSDNRDFAGAGQNGNTDSSDGAFVDSEGAIVQSMSNKKSPKETKAKQKPNAKKANDKQKNERHSDKNRADKPADKKKKGRVSPQSMYSHEDATDANKNKQAANRHADRNVKENDGRKHRARSQANSRADNAEQKNNYRADRGNQRGSDKDRDMKPSDRKMKGDWKREDQDGRRAKRHHKDADVVTNNIRDTTNH